jgi:hypothetical protein
MLTGAGITNRRLLLGGVVAIAGLGLVLAAISARHDANATRVGARAADPPGSSAPPVRLTSIDGRRVSLPEGRPGIACRQASRDRRPAGPVRN